MERDPDLLPVPEEDFLTEEEAERDPTVDNRERDGVDADVRAKE